MCVSYLARTERREAQGAGVPVLGRLGIGELSSSGFLFSVKGVTGEPVIGLSRPLLRALKFDLLVPGENILVNGMRSRV